MKASPGQVRAAIAAGSDQLRLFLLHGPDEAGALELAALLARRIGSAAERVDVEPAQLRNQPGRLAEEASSLSLFGTSRYIRVTGIGEESVEAVTLLLEAGRTGNPVVAIGPGLKATAKLVKLAQGSPVAMACACYVPIGADAERLATSIARDHGLRTTEAVARRLVAATGADRALLTRELEKLALYLDAAPDRPAQLDDTALDALAADLGEAELSQAIDALVEGDPAALGAELGRLRGSGVSAIPLLRATTRRLIAMAEMRAEIDRGVPVADVVERVFFRERPVMARALRNWPIGTIEHAIGEVRAAERAAMASGSVGEVAVAETMTRLAGVTRQRR